MQPRPDRLDVCFGSDLVGTVYDSAPPAFEYASAWLGGPRRMTLAAIPLQPGRQATPEVQAFFENLLPEGELRDDLATQRKASTLFSLLLEVGGDTAGAFVLVAPGREPEQPRHETTTWEAIAAILARRSASAIDIHAQGARISLAGAQDKTRLALFADGVPRLPKGTSPSTHILKPDTRRLAKVWHSAANEAIVMGAAALAGLPTAEVFYEPHTKACVVRRFDRQLRPDGTLARLVQYDLCQLAGTVSDRKYKKEGGQGVTLAPFYDLMCTRLYPGLSPEFAFAIGGEVRPGDMTADNLALMARQLRMQPRLLARQARDMADRVPDAIGEAAREIAPGLTPSARTVTERLERFVASTTKKLAARIAAAS